LLLAACGSGQTVGSPSDGQAAASPSDGQAAASPSDGQAAASPSDGQSEAPTAAQLAARKAFSGTTLNILLKDGYEINAIKKYYPEFQQATGIKVNLLVYDEPTALQKLTLDAAAKTGAYDITSASFWNLPQFVQGGWVQPLNDYLKNDLTAGWLYPEDMPQGALQSMTVGGNLYAVPHTIIGGMTFYRTDVFEQLGLQPPKTTADILADAKVIKEKRPDLIPFTGRGAPTFASLGTDLGWAYSYGAILFDKQNRPHADSPEMVTAMQDFVTLMKDYGPKDAATLDFTAAGEKFSSGQAAMMTDTSGFGTIFEDPTQSKVVGKVGFALPTGPAGQPVQWLYNEGLAITSDSHNKGAAWLFLQWRLSREITMKELTELHRTDVPNLYVLKSPEYAAYMKQQGLDAFATALQQSWQLANGSFWPYYAVFAKIGNQFCTGISSAIAGSISVPDALSQAQQQLTQTMAAAGYQQ
jgi:ABC-type glycerol-3-phosphate transport system substrate-binding protein